MFTPFVIYMLKTEHRNNLQVIEHMDLEIFFCIAFIVFINASVLALNDPLTGVT